MGMGRVRLVNGNVQIGAFRQVIIFTQEKVNEIHNTTAVGTNVRRQTNLTDQHFPSPNTQSDPHNRIRNETESPPAPVHFQAVKTPISYQTVMLIRHANSQNQQTGSKGSKKRS